jgi:bifunctional non-homologous end joining protein LigD
VNFGIASGAQRTPPHGHDVKRCRWAKPTLVCQVKFTEWTRDDRLRQPVFLGLREDKNASEVVREQVSAAIS